MHERLFHVILNSNAAGALRVRSLWASPAPDTAVEIESQPGHWISCKVARLIGAQLWVYAPQ
jgi:hypothetical protein